MFYIQFRQQIFGDIFIYQPVPLRRLFSDKSSNLYGAASRFQNLGNEDFVAVHAVVSIRMSEDQASVGFGHYLFNSRFSNSSSTSVSTIYSRSKSNSMSLYAHLILGCVRRNASTSSPKSSQAGKMVTSVAAPYPPLPHAANFRPLTYSVASKQYVSSERDSR